MATKPLKSRQSAEPTGIVGTFKIVDPNSLTDGTPLVPGLSSTHYDALKASIAKEGQTKPILVTEDRVVHDGRLVKRACIELGKQIMVLFITPEEAKSCWFASCSQREWTIPDRARLIAHVMKEKLYEPDPLKRGKGKASDRVAVYLQAKMGWKRDVNTGKQIQRFMNLFDEMQKASEEMLSQLDACGNLNAARKLLKGSGSTKKPIDPIKNRINLMRKWMEAYTPNPELNDSEVEEVRGTFKKAANLLASRMSPDAIIELISGIHNTTQQGQAAE